METAAPNHADLARNAAALRLGSAIGFPKGWRSSALATESLRAASTMGHWTVCGQRAEQNAGDDSRLLSRTRVKTDVVRRVRGPMVAWQQLGKPPSLQRKVLELHHLLAGGILGQQCCQALLGHRELRNIR